MGVIFENITPNSNNTHSTNHGNFSDIQREVSANFKVNNITAQNPTVVNLDKGKFRVSDVKFNDAEIGAHVNKVNVRITGRDRTDNSKSCADILCIIFITSGHAGKCSINTLLGLNTHVWGLAILMAGFKCISNLIVCVVIISFMHLRVLRKHGIERQFIS